MRVRPDLRPLRLQGRLDLLLPLLLLKEDPEVGKALKHFLTANGVTFHGGFRVPWTTFTDPEVARVGLSEGQQPGARRPCPDRPPALRRRQSGHRRRGA